MRKCDINLKMKEKVKVEVVHWNELDWLEGVDPLYAAVPSLSSCHCDI